MKIGGSDKGRLRLYMTTVIALGAGLLVYSIWRAYPFKLDIKFVVLALLTIGVTSHIVVKIPGFKSNVSVTDTAIFLTMLLFGGESAIVLGGVEAYFSSLRITWKPLTRLFNAAAMVCSTFITVWTLRIFFGPIDLLSKGEYSSKLIIATCVMAMVQYVVNSGIVAIAGAMRANLPIWNTWRKYYIYTSISYFAGASAAGMITKLIYSVGFWALIAMVPIIAIVYFTYLTYLKNVEASATQAELAERHLAELQESEERFRSAFGYAPIGMALVDPDGRWIQVNRSLSDILGYTDQELVNVSYPAITHPDDLANFVARVQQVLDGKSHTSQMETRYLHKLGREVWALVGISLIRDAKHNPLHMIFQIQDITDRKRAEQQLLHDAFHDALTGLPNRSWFMEQLRSSLERCRRHNDNFAVLFLDLDRFKVINDSIGHLVGDELLIGIANRLKYCLRPCDRVARLGGDEFTILLDHIKDTGEAVEVAERVLDQLSRPFNISGYETFTTASIGIALSNSGYEKPDDLLRDADTAMYQAKSLGKARYVIFDKGMHTRAVNLLKLETDLRRAIDRQEFCVLYQPIVHLSTGRMTGFEALVRWHHPEKGLIMPEQFITVAEETGFIVPIGRHVLQEACWQMKRWLEAVPENDDLTISVNLSNKQFGNSGLLEQIVHALEITGLDPRRLKLEITESVVMENVGMATETMTHLRALGVELGIDDFGTGYSSLSYLHRLPIDTLKIDRSFVSRLSDNSENREIVRTIIMLAQNLGMNVVAEGVETTAQLEQLVDLKCESGQGYLFSAAVDAEAAARLIAHPPVWQAASLCYKTAAAAQENPDNAQPVLKEFRYLA
jgi:diguanylate cyclase (GGDEF)-like protein/PAS domain S-box-containing protein